LRQLAIAVNVNEILGVYAEDLDFENNLTWIRRGAESSGPSV